MANHIASISSSSRAIRQHEALESSRHEEREAEVELARKQYDESAQLSATSDSAKMSAISISDNDSLASRTSAKVARSRKKRISGSSVHVVKPDLLSSKLGRLLSIDDINLNFEDEQLHHDVVLERVEQKWLEISENLESTMRHLKGCSQQVTESSSNCLQALMESVETTCDNVDAQLKAFYDLMTKCDELTTKLSIATSFREEVKSLRKFVETLEQIYKNKPRSEPTVHLPNRV